MRDRIEMFGGTGPPPSLSLVACTTDQIIVRGGDGAPIVIGDLLKVGGVSRVQLVVRSCRHTRHDFMFSTLNSVW
jgi:hypothetical protein